MSYDEYFEGADQFKEGDKLIEDKDASKVSKDTVKTIESQLWLSQDFPLKFKQFMEVLDTLAISGQASMQKIHQFLQNECLQEVANENGFPVKIQVPVGLIVKATVTFGNFRFLDVQDDKEYIEEIFAIPANCQMVSRKEAMKTL